LRVVKKLLKIVAVILGILILLVIGAYIWATVSANRIRAQKFEVHSYDFPMPFPLAESEAQGVSEADRRGVATERAIERGRHLVESRYVCTECHGKNFGGGTMIDAFPIGRLLAPNITTGKGSRTIDYKQAADWDRIVRHGVLPSGQPAVMPSEDFKLMSDQELSDVVAYVRSQPPVDNTVPSPSFGPLGKFLLATGKLKLSASVIEHQSPHTARPPASEATAEFGQHLATICIGCHRANFAGGPILGGDPSWPPARNLTQHPDGLGKVSYEQFVKTMREGIRHDGQPLKPPMTQLMPFAQKMTDVEMQALWAYLRSVPPAEAPEK